RGGVEVEWRIEGTGGPEQKADGTRDDQRGTRYGFTSTLSFPCPRAAAGNKPINEPASNSRGGKDFTIAGEIALGRGDVAGKIEAIGHGERQRRANDAVHDRRAKRQPFGQSDHQQSR